MNPFRKIANSLMNWWKGETAPEVSDSTELTGGVMTLNSPSFLESMGLSRRRKTTSEVTYFTCLKMLSETLAKMPIKYYQRTDKGIIEAEQTDTSRLLTKRPNPFMTPTVFWNTVEINRNHYGNAYVYIRKKFIRKKYGGEVKILDLWVMQSNCVQIVVDDAGIFAGKGRLWYVYTDPTSGSQYVFDTSEVMHFKTSFSFDGVTGLPVQQILRDTISGASASQRYMNSLYESGLTAKATLEYTGELNDKVEGLDAGANDYMEKPFHLQELEARIRSLTRRKFVQKDVCLESGDIKFDTIKREAYAKEIKISLTRKEKGILEYLLLNLGRPVSQEELMEHVWDASVDSFSGAIRVHMSSLRRKLKAVLGYDPILNKVGEGYKIREESDR